MLTRFFGLSQTKDKMLGQNCHVRHVKRFFVCVCGGGVVALLCSMCVLRFFFCHVWEQSLVFQQDWVVLNWELHFDLNIGSLGNWVRSYGFVFRVSQKRGIISRNVFMQSRKNRGKIVLNIYFSPCTLIIQPFLTFIFESWISLHFHLVIQYQLTSWNNFPML